MDIDSTIIPRPALLERLRRGAGDGTGDWADITIDSRKALAEAVADLTRDLRRLLNTRRSFDNLPARFEALEGTVLGYGLPDTTLSSLQTTEQRVRFRRDLEATIQAFEPRLSELRLEETVLGRSHAQRIGIRISALFEVDGQPVPVVFDTLVNDIHDRVMVEAGGGSA